MIGATEESRAVFDHAAEAERVVRCFDPDAVYIHGVEELLIISPRWGRLRRRHPLLASAPHEQGAGAAWMAARNNLVNSTDRSVQLAIATYEHRVRATVRVSLQVLSDPRFDLHRHCHAVLDKGGAEKNAVPLRRDTFWIRTLLPDPEGYVQFEIGNTFLVPITEEAIILENKTLL